MDYLIRRIQDNPFARQLIRDGGRPEKQRELALLALFFSACLIALNTLTPPANGQTLSMLYYEASFPFAWRLFDSQAGFVLTLTLVVLIPPVVAVYTAISISRHASSASLQELRLTPLGERSIVQGYMWAALFRMPVVVALTTGLCVSLLVRAPFYVPRFTNDQLSHLLFALLRVISTVDILARLWLAVAAGVMLALWIRGSPFLAGLCSLGATLSVTLAIVAGQSIVRSRLQLEYAKLLNLWGFGDLTLMALLVRVPLAFDILSELAWTGVAVGLAVISAYWARRGISLERIVG